MCACSEFRIGYFGEACTTFSLSHSDYEEMVIIPRLRCRILSAKLTPSAIAA
jgi:hypothetical protein